MQVGDHLIKLERTRLNASVLKGRDEVGDRALLAVQNPHLWSEAIASLTLSPKMPVLYEDQALFDQYTDIARQRGG